MTEIDQIKPRQIFLAVVEGTADTSVFMKVQAVPGDGRVIISPVGNRKVALITTPEVLLNGGVLDGGRLGRLIFPPQIGGNLDVQV